MKNDPAIASYRRWYRRLLRFHSRPYRERFGEEMEQTFSDLCRERVSEGKGLGGFVLWLFAETTAGIIRENGRCVMQNKYMVRLAIVTGCLLLIPIFGNLYVEGWNWGPFDFVFAGSLVFGTGMAYQFVAQKSGVTSYRLAVGVALVTAFLLLWINAAVGVIGDEEFTNALLVVVPLGIGVVGSIRAGFVPRGMSLVLFTMAIAQAVIPLIAAAWVPLENFSPGFVKVQILNAFFVAMWVVSGLLFHHAGGDWRNIEV